MGTTNPSNSVQTPGSNGGMPDESLQRALVTLNTQMATKATLATDASGNVTGLVGPGGAAVVSYGSIVATSRSVAPSDFDVVLKCASGITITIPTDAVLGISDPSYSPTINIYQAGASAVTMVTTGLTIRGTQRTISQYGVFGIMRVGANEWAYL